MPWPTTGERFVAFLDVMGFKRLVAERSSSRLYALMRDLHDEAREAERMARGIRAGSAAGTASVTRSIGNGHRGSDVVRLVQFSDALVAITRDGSDVSSLAVRLAAMKLFLATLTRGIALRGAIAFGEITADFGRSIFFGQPIVDAYVLEEDQNWFGVVEHDDCATAFRPAEGIQPLGSDEIPLSDLHDVSLKSGRRQLSALNWPVLLSNKDDIGRLLAPFDIANPSNLHSYYEATLAFGLKMWDKHRR